MSNECSIFQDYVSNAQFRNKSILDIVTKLSEQTAMLDRAVFKSVTHCGCIKINAEKQVICNDKTIEENKCILKSHVQGDLCPKCKEKIEEEMGDLIFYLVSLCDTLDIKLSDVISQKLDYLKTLGIYSLL